MNNVDKQYFNLCKEILSNGIEKKDRTGTGTKSIFDYTMRFKMSEGFPLLTSKRVFTKAIIHELIWFLKGDTNIKYLLENGVHIWDGDAYKFYLNYHNNHPTIHSNRFDFLNKKDFLNKILNDETFSRQWGDLGPIYGHQWRNLENICFDRGECWNEGKIDQIKNLIDDLKNNPDSRRLIVSSWNVTSIQEMRLPPCHYTFQCYTYEMSLRERCLEFSKSLGKDISYSDDMTTESLDELKFPKRKLSLKWTQRSVDTALGLPFNIASYALLLHLLAKEVNMIPDDLIFSGGDCHIYLDQIDGIKEQLGQETFNLPKIELTNKSIFDFKFDDVNIIDYESSKSIKMPLSN